MYKTRYSNLKNVKAEEWMWIGQEIQRRDALGKESQPYLHERPLPSKRVARELARHRHTWVVRSTYTHSEQTPFQGRVSVRTPPSTFGGVEILAQNALDSASDDRFRLSVEIEHTETTNVQQPYFHREATPVQITELVDTMDIDTCNLENSNNTSCKATFPITLRYLLITN